MATYNNAIARLYVDGVQVASKSSNVQLTPNNNSFNIARSSAGTSSLNAVIDEVAVYGAALSVTRIQAHFNAARVDIVAPAPTLDAPANGSVSNDTTPTFSGTAGNAGGDSTSVTVKVYAGPTPTGTPVQTRATTRTGATYTVDASPPLAGGTYTARAEQNDESSNLGLSSPTTFAVDTTPPTSTITEGPPDPSNSTSALFSFTANEAGSTFHCSIDGAAFAVCESPKDYSNFADGNHSFQVKATDAAGNTGSPVSYDWEVDTVAPTATITDAPADPSGSSSASFSFATNEPGSTFRCNLDEAAFEVCSSPTSYSSLGDGTHALDVKAVDSAGNEGSPVSHSWRVDTTGPVIALTAPADGSETNDPTPTFAGIAGTATGDAGTVTVNVYSGPTPTGTPLFSLLTTRDSGGVYQVEAAEPLGDGTYTARAEQSDSVGNSGLSSANTFVVNEGGPDGTPPAVTLVTPESGSSTNDTTPSFAGTAGTHAGDLPEVTVNVYDGTDPIGTPIQTLAITAESNGSYSVDADPALAEGTYTAQSEQFDDVGNHGFSVARTFSVDTTPPSASITGTPADPSNSSSASFSFTSDAAGSTFRCSLDGAAFAPCSSPELYSGLGNGEHDFQVKAFDPAGNESPVESYGWTIDTVAPIATITGSPTDPSNSSSASFSFSSNETGSTFGCSLDGSAFAPCPSPQAYTELANSAHTFQVRAIDTAGNTGSSP